MRWVSQGTEYVPRDCGGVNRKGGQKSGDWRPRRCEARTGGGIDRLEGKARQGKAPVTPKMGRRCPNGVPIGLGFDND